MKIIQTNNVPQLDDTVLKALSTACVYPMSDVVMSRVIDCLIPGATAILFSGGWRFNLDAIYFEEKKFKALPSIKTHDKMYFVTTDNIDLVTTVLKKTSVKNILFLHSAEFCNYRCVSTLIDCMNDYLIPGAQAILTVPTIRTDFNRLKYSCKDIAQKYSAEYVDHAFIFKRNQTQQGEPA